MSKIAVITTLPDDMYNVYGKQMIESFTRNWPAEVLLLVQLDSPALSDSIDKLLRRDDALSVGWEKDHEEFVTTHKDKDHKTNYRYQATRFCHKVFAIRRVLTAIRKAKAEGQEVPRYLIWLDADVITTRKITLDEVKECLPKEGDAVSYLGRKDWNHSECGWLAFDLENGGDKLIDDMVAMYLGGEVFNQAEWHDSFLWDVVMKDYRKTNLTQDKPGMDIWPESPMGKWSVHYKGPQAKAAMAQKPQMGGQKGGIQIITQNAIPHEQLRAHIEKNQALIDNWVRPCAENDEEIVVVSAGPMLIAEDLRQETGKIVAVKHAMEPLQKAGITPWACILLDPRPHMMDFVKEADPRVIWFVASQVNPLVTMQLLQRGCKVFGYHASVGADEETLTKKQDYAVIGGGSATATRGLYLLNHLGFKNFKLYGYDLSLPDKPDLNALDDRGQPKYLEMSVGMNDPLFNLKRIFYTEPQLVAQFEEMNIIMKDGRFKVRAHGDGMVPFMLKAKSVAELRRKELSDKIKGENPPHYSELIK